MFPVAGDVAAEDEDRSGHAFRREDGAWTGAPCSCRASLRINHAFHPSLTPRGRFGHRTSPPRTGCRSSRMVTLPFAAASPTPGPEDVDVRTSRVGTDATRAVPIATLPGRERACRQFRAIEGNDDAPEHEILLTDVAVPCLSSRGRCRIRSVRPRSPQRRHSARRTLAKA